MTNQFGTPTEGMTRLYEAAKSGKISKKEFAMAFQMFGGFESPMLFEKPQPEDQFDPGQAQQGLDAYQMLGKFPEYMKTDPSYEAERTEFKALKPEQRDKLLNPPKPPTEFEAAKQQMLGRYKGVEGVRKAQEANMSLADMLGRADQFFGKLPEGEKLGALQGAEQALQPPERIKPLPYTTSGGIVGLDPYSLEPVAYTEIPWGNRGGGDGRRPPAPEKSKPDASNIGSVPLSDYNAIKAKLGVYMGEDDAGYPIEIDPWGRTPTQLNTEILAAYNSGERARANGELTIDEIESMLNTEMKESGKGRGTLVKELLDAGQITVEQAKELLGLEDM